LRADNLREIGEAAAGIAMHSERYPESSQQIVDR
jgi:hypothetical protein